MALAHLPTRIARRLRRLGLRARTWAISDERILIFRRTLDAAGDPRFPAGVHLETNIPAARLHSLRARSPVPGSFDGIARSLRDGDMLHVALRGDAIVGWGVSATPDGAWPITETRTTLAIPPGECVLTAFEVLPEMRGQGIYGAILEELLRYHRSRGESAAWIWCDETNAPSRKAIERRGFRVCAIHSMRRRFGRRTTSIAPP